MMNEKAKTESELQRAESVGNGDEEDRRVGREENGQNRKDGEQKIFAYSVFPLCDSH